MTPAKTRSVNSVVGGMGVMTWNVHGSARPNLRSVAGWIQNSDATVVLLQEVQQKQARRLAEILGWTFVWSLKHSPLVKPAEGLAILSPHPIVLAATPVLSEGAKRQSFRRRIAQIADIRMPHAAFRVCNVHLASGKSDARPGQVTRLLEHLSGVELLGGDLNDGPDSAVIANLLPMGFRRTESGPTAWSTVGANNPPSITIDHLLVRGSWRLQRAREFAISEIHEIRRLSDHLPVIAQLEG
jgi:endonuclease/exonuclease/phosphatase family metal-dependent hydrolase